MPRETTRSNGFGLVLSGLREEGMLSRKNETVLKMLGLAMQIHRYQSQSIGIDLRA
jgi:hypothetical protein